MEMYARQRPKKARGRGPGPGARLAGVTRAPAAHPLDYLDTADDVDVFLASIQSAKAIALRSRVDSCSR